ncbi:MAG: hypothetical protein HY390_00320 [Deltaproteobacteria bacterium]|nr:hypothetical protein [Deltaproteobacteria bacterium]
MSDILSFRQEQKHSTFLAEQVRLYELKFQIEEVLQTWSYVPLMDLPKEVGAAIDHVLEHFFEIDMPLRFWTAQKATTFSCSLLTPALLESKAELIALTFEILKTIGFRHAKLQLRDPQFKQLSRCLRTFGLKIPIYSPLDPVGSDLSVFHFEFLCGQAVLAWGADTGFSRQNLFSDLAAYSSHLDLASMVDLKNKYEHYKEFVQSDFLVVNRKETDKSAIEIVRVLRGQGFDTAYDFTGRAREALLAYARRMGILNLILVGEHDTEKDEVTLVDVWDGIPMKLKISDMFDQKSSFRKMLRFQKRWEEEA